MRPEFRIYVEWMQVGNLENKDGAPLFSVQPAEGISGRVVDLFEISCSYTQNL